MKRLLGAVLVLGLAIGHGLPGARAGEPEVHAGPVKCAAENGDVNADGMKDITDPITLLTHLFLGDPPELAPLCDPPRIAILEETNAQQAEQIAALEETNAQLTETNAQLLERLSFFVEFTLIGSNDQGYSEYRHNQSGIVFVRLPGGSFEMGSPDNHPSERPVHTVRLSPFLLAKFECTQAEYEAVMGSNPSLFTGDLLRPVEQVSYDALTAADGFLDRTGLGLPTEAQWEYACRAGTTGDYGGTGILDEMGWCSADPGTPITTHPVGEKKPNDFGLHDMHGNVYEWCEDWYRGNFYGTPEATELDPVNDTASGIRVVRGGAWNNFAEVCRSAKRVSAEPLLAFNVFGFRPAFSLP